MIYLEKERFLMGLPLKAIKRALGIILTVVLLFVLVRVGYIIASAYMKVPEDYPGSVWVSEDPEILMQIPEEGSPQGLHYIETYITRDGETQRVDFPIYVPFGFASIDEYVEKFSTQPIKYTPSLLSGTTLFTSKKKVIILVEDDRLYDGAYRFIVLRREK